MKYRHLYEAIQQCHEEKGYAVDVVCKFLQVSRSAFYKWADGKVSRREAMNEEIARKVEEIHMEHPDKGYRRINDDLKHDHDIHVNDKRVLRICRVRKIRSTIKYSNHGCTRRAKDPQYIAENLLNRQFHADKPNEKWLTDVTEFKWYEGTQVHKIYLSAILDLYDRRIVFEKYQNLCEVKNTAEVFTGGIICKKCHFISSSDSRRISGASFARLRLTIRI